MSATEHVIDVKFEGGVGRPIYRAVCSCGEYRSAKCGSPGKAESAGLDHAKAKSDA